MSVSGAARPAGCVPGGPSVSESDSGWGTGWPRPRARGRAVPALPGRRWCAPEPPATVRPWTLAPGGFGIGSQQGHQHVLERRGCRRIRNEGLRHDHCDRPHPTPVLSIAAPPEGWPAPPPGSHALPRIAESGSGRIRVVCSTNVPGRRWRREDRECLRTPGRASS